MAENPLHRPDTEPDPARQESSESNIVCDSWQQMIQGVLGVLMLIGALALVHYYAPLRFRGCLRMTCRSRCMSLQYKSIG